MPLQCLVPVLGSEKLDENLLLRESSATLLPFSREVVEFIDGFSKALLSDAAVRSTPELVALGFWMRKSSISRFEEEFRAKNKDRIKLARGTVFQIAPSNVDTLFIYSLFISLLMGNRNIVRVSQKASHQKDLLLQTLNHLLEQESFASLRDFLYVVSYEHSDGLTASLSRVCDVRVVWGGDATINAISRIPVPPGTLELKFADKYSFAVIDSSVVETLTEQQLEQLTEHFVNDAYAFAQMACSSPRTVIWLGDSAKASVVFWQAVSRRLEHYDHQLQPADCMNKLVASYAMAIERQYTIETDDSHLVSRVRASALKALPDDLHCGSGLFVESSVDCLDQLKPLLTGKVQTLSYFGVDRGALQSWASSGLNGIDRIVPVGQALNFHRVWDGFDLTESLTREITIL